MYKIATALRRQLEPNIFRRTILGALGKNIGDDILICSGFFQEKQYKKSAYYASQSFISALPQFPCRIKFTTVGVYNRYIWGSQYDQFVSSLRSINCMCGVPLAVEQRAHKTTNKWHAKIFIIRNNDRPCLAVIGSSNITRNAFDEFRGWNRECDVIVWDSSSLDTDSAVRKAILGESANEQPESDGEERSNEVIVSRYDAEDPLNSTNRPMEQRLNDLWLDVIGSTYEV